MEGRVTLVAFCLLAMMAAVSVAEIGHEERGEYELDKRAALADFRRRFESPRRHSARNSHHHARQQHGDKRAALADFKRAALADFKRAALADFKRAALADFKRAALADFKRAALADFKRAALADFKRSHHAKGGHHHVMDHQAEIETEEKRSYYWDICTKSVNGRERMFACKKPLQ